MANMDGLISAELKWDMPVTLLSCTTVGHKLAVFILATCLCSVNCVNYVTDVYSDQSNNGVINNLAVHESSGKVFLGAVNSVYQLNENLVIEKTVTTGPRLDTPNCRPQAEACACDEWSPNDCDAFKKKPTDSVNKALLIDYDTNRLITCSNLRQGQCEKRWLSNISQTDPDIYVPVVSYDLISPVVMYIAPGLTNKKGANSKVLYVASTYSTVGLSSYTDMVPSISSRNTSTFEKVYEDILQDGSFLSMQAMYRDNFRVYYKTGFYSGGFSYFLAVQPESHAQHSRNVTKIMRVCENDETFRSYVEMPLKCTHNDVDYDILQDADVIRPASKLAQSMGLSHLDQNHLDDVIFAIFSRHQPHQSPSQPESAMCLYSLRDVRQKFTSAIQNCFDGIGNTGPSHFKPIIACQRLEFQVLDDYCGTQEVNNPISGSDPENSITAEAAIVFPSTVATAITMTTTQDFTVAFVGTADGKLKKVVVESQRSAVNYETVVVEEGVVVNPDLAMDRPKSHVYVVTGKKVSKLRVEQCGQYVTCADCLAAKDPYCGWCSLENKCSLKRDCLQADQPLQWLDYVGQQCTKILDIMPAQVPMVKGEGSHKLTLTVQNLPLPVVGNYQCAFTSPGMTPRYTTATRQGAAKGVAGNSTLLCDTPAYNLLPVIQTGYDHIVLRLSVRMDNKDFVSEEFTFFDCSRHDSCSECTESAFPCTWCVRSHKCTHDREWCGSDVLVTGQNVKGQSDTPGPEHCPKIEASFTEILVPNQEEKQVQVKATYLNEFQRDFKCIFSEEGSGETTVGAELNESTETITCQSVKFQYTSDTDILKIPFKIVWGRHAKKALDNPDKIQVVVYKCEVMANNCGECLTQPDGFKCGWCESEDTCTIRENCPAHSSSWLGDDAICPNPAISDIEPVKGPRQGGTKLTITGMNLGIIFDDVRGGITIGSVDCIAIEEAYRAATRITCETRASHEDTSEEVEVVVKGQLTARSHKRFSFVSPSMTNFHPKQGPRSGGTRITIHGVHLAVGSSVTASVMANPCTILRKTEFTVECLTPPAEGADSGDVTMSLDNAQLGISGGSGLFQYMDDPEINKVDRSKGVPSGGTSVDVEGVGLSLIQHPQMVVYSQGQQFIDKCHVKSDTHMKCTAPTVSSLLDMEIPPENPVHLSYGFILDNVTDVKNMTLKKGESFIFEIYPDPEFQQFQEGVKSFQGDSDYLTINGNNLNLAVTEKDVKVSIGEHPCNVTSISLTQLNCAMPEKKLFRAGDPVVIIRVGNLTFIVGKLTFDSGSSGSDGGLTSFASLPLQLIVPICAVPVLLVAVIIVACLLYRRKARESNRVQKDMQHRMDLLEASVAKECKEAFAELQTDMTVIARDISGTIGIPFRSYKDFCMKMLFPNVPADEHPVIKGFEIEYSRHAQIDKGLKDLNKLIENNTFLLEFIRTLESNEDFGMRDRVNVASLISVALQDRMEYHTEILKVLLAELIDKSMASGKNPKLLLRRTESVAEKMLANWFTFLLHKFLTECAGEPLFMLFCAIKQQIDKGPVDALTSEARYSLSEDKLIRQHVDYRVLSLRVLNTKTSAETVVKVLDCDSISQVKEKILDALYKNAPFSTRPDKNDLELEWQTGVKGRLILQDEDRTTKPEPGNWKKLNTLAHYNVTDGALVALVPKQSSMFNLSTLSHSVSNHHFPANYKDSPSLSRSMSPESRVDIESITANTYHLVKASDVEDTREGNRGPKMVSEIYLTRLLATKGTLQMFVDALFKVLFNVEGQSNGRQSYAHENGLYDSPAALPGRALPLAIKYMFDFLDDQALHHMERDPEVVHTWKSNSLPLRFWVNIVKNPDFVFDIRKSNIVDACLSVVAQTLMDSCTMSEISLTKDSPSSKLLYAKDIPQCKRWVASYYQHIKQMPAISDQDMNAMLAEESRQHASDFKIDAAVYELYKYIKQYNTDLMKSLEENEFARRNRLAARLDSVHYYMNNPGETYA